MSPVTQRPRPTSRSAAAGSGRAAELTPAGLPVRPLPVSTALAALAIAGAGLVLAIGLAVIGWLGADDGGAGDAVRVGVTAWLAGHGGAPRVGAATLGLVPLGVPLLVVLAARRAGRWALGTSASAGDLPAACAVGTAGVAYGLPVAGLAVLAVPDGVAVDPVRAGAVAAVLAAAGVAAGLAPGVGWVARAISRSPAMLLAAVRGAAVGLVTALALSALTLLATLLVHGSDVLALGARLGPGPVGGWLLVVAGLLLVPNAVLWSASYLLGPGFSVGAGTAVSPTGVVLGTLPAYPPLAALPAPGDQPVWASVLLVLPVGAGVVAGVVAGRRLTTGRWWRTAAAGVLAGMLAGVALALLLLVAGGAIGPGRLADAGPVRLAGVLAVGSLGLGGLLGGVGARALGERTALAGWVFRLRPRRRPGPGPYPRSWRSRLRSRRLPLGRFRLPRRLPWRHR